jgi:hypothetical protein
VPSPAAHRDYACGMVGLGIWYVHRAFVAGRVPARSLVDALSRRVNLYRLTTWWDGVHDVAAGDVDARWSALAVELAHLIATAPAATLEARALAVLEPWLAAAPPAVPTSAFGCWSHRMVGRGIADRPGVHGRVRAAGRWLRRRCGGGEPIDQVELHFANAFAPESPFRHAQALRASLLTLVRDCRVRAPHVVSLWCNSWLNEHPAFTALFPPAWRREAVPRPPEVVDAMTFGRARLNTENWWGQFMRRDGSFHRELAHRFRTSDGVFPYGCRLGHTTLAALEQHLEAAPAAAVPT